MRLTRMVDDIPTERVDAVDVIQAAGGSRSEARVFSKLFGIEQVAALPHTVSLLHTFSTLLDRLEVSAEETPVDTLIYVHALPIQSVEGEGVTTELVRRHPALKQVKRRYEIDQHNCGGGFWGLKMLQTLFRTGLSQRALLLLGDSLSVFGLGERYIPGCTILGDGFVVMLLDNRDDGIQLTPPFGEHRAEFWPGLFIESPQKSAFYAEHNAMMAHALKEIDFSFQTHDVLLPHNINRLTWLNFTRRNPEFEARIDTRLLPDVGHCCAADPFLLLSRRLQNTQPLSKRCGLLSIGAGAFIGACNVIPDPRYISRDDKEKT
ncbi:3-oxoacyl-ACP synthase [Lonsdalea quercina]|uniref:3-oxoacyl-ACP synthase n=1 Tax=Lonsdalea quercina TaxID=71657 RepID=UPI003974F319